jgi:ribonuclease P protein component
VHGTPRLEANIPAQPPPPQEEARLQSPDEVAGRAGGSEAPPPQGTRTPERLSGARPAGRQQFGRDRRIRKRAEFLRLYQEGRKAGTRSLVVYALPSGASSPRLGITVSSKVGNSVVRNRAKRLIREAYRRMPSIVESGLDLVINGRQAIAETSFPQVCAELEQALRRLLDSRSERRG